MGDILIQAGMLIAVIALGYLLKRTGILPREAFGIVSKIVLWVTLPSVVICNFAKTNMDAAYLWMIVIGFGTMALLAWIGYWINRKKSVDEQVFDMLNLTGFNIGCFALPYISGLLGPAAVTAVCMFDAGGGLGSGGGVNALCASMQENGRFRPKEMLIKLGKIFLLVVYVVMILLRSFAIPIPSLVVRFCELCGAGNRFLAMLMIGLGLSFTIPKNQMRWIGKAILIRYGIAIALGFLFYQFLPFSEDVRLGAVIAVLAPVASLAPPFTQERGGDYELSSGWNTLTIIISLGLITAVMLLKAGI